ncbi:Tim44 domain-containing protein [Desulfovibrio ferrophilus]|uniref:Import inner membrane translocase subunit Tim44 n=1 Tax=Desulfovibrio ferrophilus TaxID=241368 RepID=A0A2Z6B0Y9_9BACT|nr:Tim44-like domain-containing protein [Desulfovibrio ferrophilus]BBD09179.1 Import inner membrane translocase subunit Tim44 [Desulfovibrio ferrophilus]
MRTAIKFMIVPLLLVALIAMDAGFADAKRFGGGRSFGGSRSFSKSYSKPVSPTKQGTAGSTATQGTQRPSRFGGMGGMFGGLLAGTLLGSMFFGHPFAGGGMMDILLIGGLIFLAMKLFRRRRPAPQVAGGRSGGMSYGGGGPQPHEDSSMQRQAHGAWGGLGSTQGAAESAPELDLPAGFDTDEFLEGAKLAFNRLQASWDSRDMDDISQFTTGAVLNEIKSQAAQDPGPSRTEILMVNARLLEVKQEGGATLATVYFDALMREDTSGGSEQVREVWHFKQDDTVQGGMWLVDGLQQLEN